MASITDHSIVVNIAREKSGVIGYRDQKGLCFNHRHAINYVIITSIRLNVSKIFKRHYCKNYSILIKKHTYSYADVFCTKK